MSDKNHFRSKLLLFLSADIVGSTAYKSKFNSSLGWINAFTDFQEDFEVALKSELNNKANINKFIEENEYIPAKLNLWKSLGDEIIYTFEPKNHIELQYFVLCFKNAIEYYSNEISKNSKLSLKGCGWTAGFPVGNYETSSNDYIGPSIDIGFRISKSATPYKFVISVELALLIASNPERCFEFHMDEPIILKGVLNNQPYPIIWLKCKNDHKDNEYKLLKKYQVPCPDAEIKDYCRTYIEDSGKPLMIPFFSNDNDPLFNKRPGWYDEEFQQIQQIFEDKEDLEE